MSDIVPTILFYLLVLTLVVGVLAAATFFGIARLEAAHPPMGQFIEVQGVRLHVAVLGLPRDAPGAEPGVVLIHGASGNLEDMRLALGEKLALSHRVILVDRPGHGWSSRPESDDYASPARQAELVADALEQLGPVAGKAPTHPVEDLEGGRGLDRILVIADGQVSIDREHPSLTAARRDGFAVLVQYGGGASQDEGAGFSLGARL